MARAAVAEGDARPSVPPRSERQGWCAKPLRGRDGGSYGETDGATHLRLAPSGPATLVLPDVQALRLSTDREVLALRRSPRPAWASAMGRDRYGLWAEIAIEGPGGSQVVQRLRWIPPGCFLMGSPDDEPERLDYEGPRHVVTIETGYWLFDTVCSQALWIALLGENPSRFQDPDRPVERVSWQDMHEGFLPALNSRIPGFALPSEAQWERACRAGTETALYSGPIEVLGDLDAPALDPIAWYGGNSGVNYDLEEGDDSTKGWWIKRHKQYDHVMAGTRKVKHKAPNPWGLYDMLGNVWGWVEDSGGATYEGAPTDGSVRQTDAVGVNRVIRGGSWYGGARVCRCACRIDAPPDYRLDYLGFRCARVQDR